MKFATKLRKYLEEKNIKNSHFAKSIGVSPAMIHKYLYSGSLPLYYVADRIDAATNGYISKEEISEESIVRNS